MNIDLISFVSDTLKDASNPDLIALAESLRKAVRRKQKLEGLNPEELKSRLKSVNEDIKRRKLKASTNFAFKPSAYKFSGISFGSEGERLWVKHGHSSLKEWVDSIPKERLIKILGEAGFISTESVVTEARGRILKAPSPEFLMARLKARKPAIILSGAGHEKLVGEEFTLVNEKTSKTTPIQAFGVVTFKQESSPINSTEDLGGMKDSVDPVMVREFSVRKGPIFILKLSLKKAFAKPKTLKSVPPGRFSAFVNLPESDGKEITVKVKKNYDGPKSFDHRDHWKEAFHLRDVHWVPVPESGTCPSTHPTKLKFPGTDTLRCFRPAAATAVRGMNEQERPSLKAQTYILSKERFKTQGAADKWMDDNDVPRPKVDETESSFRYRQFPPDRCQEGSARTSSITDGVQIVGCRLKRQSEQVEKLTNERAQLREANPDNPTERCALCAYFQEPTGCKIIEGPVGKDLVCDWIDSVGTKVDLYNVNDEDWLAFVKGMIDKQPYSHIVRDGAITPEGPLVLIEDTAKPPHRFSLTKEFHIKHTVESHHWAQAEVDDLVKDGKGEGDEQPT